MDLLVLGGTAWLGRAIAQSAQHAGFDVTCAARGTGPAPEGVEMVRIDRDDDDGLQPLLSRHWDAVVDVSRHPGQVRRAVRDLTTDHWVYISSGNVYARFDMTDQHESSPTVPPLEGDVMTTMRDYGAAKVACEDAVRAADATATIIRAGLIGGPGDWSGRSGYYPWRFSHPTGEDVLVPPDPSQPVALIDVEDLADFVVLMAEDMIDKTMNATGRATTVGAVIDASREVAGSTATPRPVPAETLADAGIEAWMGTPSLPLWLDDADWRGFATLSSTRADSYGLVTRPLAETLARALDYEEQRAEPRHAGLTDDEERSLRALLDASA